MTARLDDIFINRRVRRREQNLTVGIGKSEAEVTKNKRRRSTFLQTDTKHRAASMLQQSYLYACN